MRENDDCRNCGTALPMCVYWKMHGYVACCPECKHPKSGQERQVLIEDADPGRAAQTEPTP